MLIRAALVSPPGSGFDALAERLSLDPGIHLGFFRDLAAARDRLPAWPCHALAIRVPELDDAKVAWAARARAAFPQQGLLISAERAEASALAALRSLPRAAAIDERRELPDAAKLLKKAALGEPHGPRAHPRAKREGPVEIRDANGRTIAGRFVDFGPMGARIELSPPHSPRPHSPRSEARLAPRSLVTISYASSVRAAGGARRWHRIEASVAWTRSSASPWIAFLAAAAGASETLGLRFIAIRS